MAVHSSSPHLSTDRITPRGGLGRGLIVLCAATLLIAAVIVRQVVQGVQQGAADAHRSESATTSIAGEPDPSEYIVFFHTGMQLEAERVTLAGHRGVSLVGPGKLPGVMVVRLAGKPEQILPTLAGEPGVLAVRKSTKGMICH